MSASLVSPVVVGRDDELAVLGEAFARVQEGSPATVLIGGEAGVGKSRLATEFTASLSGTARVLVGGCVELGEYGLAFAPFTAVLRGLVREIGVDGVAERLPRGEVVELGRLLPVLGRAEGDDAAGLARARLFEEFLTLLAVLAEQRAVVLVIEDVHWADRSSRELLDFLVRNLHAAPGLLTIVTHRSDQPHRAHPLRRLLAELDRMAWVTRLELGRLTRNDVTGQLRALLGHEPDAELSAGIFRRSEGNPLFVEALSARIDAPVPESIRDLLITPLERFPPRTRQVVRAAAVGGVRVGHALLSAVTGLGDAALADALRPAVRSNRMLVEESTYVFRHALIREVLYEDMLPGERAPLHLRYAGILEADPSLTSPGRAAVESAHHWYASKRRPAMALTAAWRAAAEALASLAYAERLHMLLRARCRSSSCGTASRMPPTGWRGPMPRCWRRRCGRPCRPARARGRWSWSPPPSRSRRVPIRPAPAGCSRTAVSRARPSDCQATWRTSGRRYGSCPPATRPARPSSTRSPTVC